MEIEMENRSQEKGFCIRKFSAPGSFFGNFRVFLFGPFHFWNTSDKGGNVHLERAYLGNALFGLFLEVR